MPSYLVFGACLRSDVVFPGLPEARQELAPAWTLRSEAVCPSLEGAVMLGEDRVNDQARVRLYRAAGSFRLEYDDTGSFDLGPNGRQITWCAGPKAPLEAVRADVTGRVLATAMHAAGLVCLHASAIQLGGGAVAFLGGKRSGKSTLAMGALRQGAKLLTDDSLPVESGPGVRARPGVFGVRLWEDSLGRWSGPGRVVEAAGGKRLLTDLPPDSLVADPIPLAALYLLAPSEPNPNEPPVGRVPVPPMLATVALVKNAKIGPLLGREEAPVLLERMAALADRVPVFVLRVVRDLDLLDSVVAQLREWHGSRRADPTGEAPTGPS